MKEKMHACCHKPIKGRVVLDMAVWKHSRTDRCTQYTNLTIFQKSLSLSLPSYQILLSSSSSSSSHLFSRQNRSGRGRLKSEGGSERERRSFSFPFGIFFYFQTSLPSFLLLTFWDSCFPSITRWGRGDGGLCPADTIGSAGYQYDRTAIGGLVTRVGTGAVRVSDSE